MHRIAYDPEGWVFLPRFAWGPEFFPFLFNVFVAAQVGIKNKRKQMSDDESETIYSSSEMSEDSESEGSIADFVVDDEEELEVCVSCRAEICKTNVINRKRRHESSSYDEGESDDEEESDSSSDYVPSEAGDSSSEADESSEDE